MRLGIGTGVSLFVALCALCGALGVWLAMVVFALVIQILRGLVSGVIFLVFLARALWRTPRVSGTNVAAFEESKNAHVVMKRVDRLFGMAERDNRPYADSAQYARYGVAVWRETLDA